VDTRFYWLGGVLAVLGVAYWISSIVNPEDITTKAERACKAQYPNNQSARVDCTVELIMRASSDREKIDAAYAAFVDLRIYPR
jgi:hypothetical protein